MKEQNEETGDKLSIAQCRKILKDKSRLYTDEEIIQLRDFLYILAEIEYSIKTQNNGNEQQSGTRAA